MKSFILKTFCAVSLLSFVTVPAMAASMTGLILESKDVQVKNKDVKNKVILLKTQDDHIIVADLGPAKDLQDVAFDKDKEIYLEGDRVRIGNRPVLLVTKTNIDNREVKIKRSERTTAVKSPDMKKVKGEITNEKNVELKGKNQSHKVVMLTTEKGNQVVADLGPQKKLQELNIEKGKKLEVQGRIDRVSDHLVLFADKVMADGKTVEVQRTEKKSG
jgi:hypothetical protein